MESSSSKIKIAPGTPSATGSLVDRNFGSKSLMSPSTKRAQLDILDVDLEHDGDKNHTATLQIFKKANRLRNKIKAIQIASKLGKSVHDHAKEEKKKPAAMEVYKPPDCLKNVLIKIKQEKRDRKEDISADDDK